jgi:uncharacterized membrane protein
MEGARKVFSAIIGAVLAIYGLFRIPSAVITNSWGDLVISAVLMFLGFWILSKAAE